MLYGAIYLKYLWSKKMKTIKKSIKKIMKLNFLKCYDEKDTRQGQEHMPRNYRASNSFHSFNMLSQTYLFINTCNFSSFHVAHEAADIGICPQNLHVILNFQNVSLKAHF